MPPGQLDRRAAPGGQDGLAQADRRRAVPRPGTALASGVRPDLRHRLGPARGHVVVHLHHVGPAASGRPAGELSVVAVAGTGEHHRRSQVPAGQLMKHVQDQPPLLAVPHRVGHACPDTAVLDGVGLDSVSVRAMRKASRPARIPPTIHLRLPIDGLSRFSRWSATRGAPPVSFEDSHRSRTRRCLPVQRTDSNSSPSISSTSADVALIAICWVACRLSGSSVSACHRVSRSACVGSDPGAGSTSPRCSA